MTNTAKSAQLHPATHDGRTNALLRHAARAARRHTFKITALVLASAFWTELPYRLIGLVNRHTGFLRSVFYCYPGDSRYARHYCYSWCDRWLRWLPSPIGIFRQGGTWGLALASPVTERDFTDASNDAGLQLLLRRIERIARLVGAAETNLAGVLPSVLYRRYGVKTDRLPLIVDIVCDAISQTRAAAFDGADVPIMLLGGSGFLGRSLHLELIEQGRDVHVVDRVEGSEALPTALQGRDCLLVDVARQGVLARYIEQLWPGLAVLNETFPEPSKHTRSLLRQRGVPVYHLAGTPARIWPSLPHGYRDCVPCCAMHDTSAATAVVRRLV